MFIFYQARYALGTCFPVTSNQGQFISHRAAVAASKKLILSNEVLSPFRYYFTPKEQISTIMRRHDDEPMKAKGKGKLARHVLVIVGASGSGKTQLIKKTEQATSQFWR